MARQHTIMAPTAQKSGEKKMNLARALTIMGLRATRQFENASVENRQKEIDKAHQNRMVAIQV